MHRQSETYAKKIQLKLIGFHCYTVNQLQRKNFLTSYDFGIMGYKLIEFMTIVFSVVTASTYYVQVIQNTST